MSHGAADDQCLPSPQPMPPPLSSRLIREEAQRMSHGAADDVAVPFGRIQEITAKYNLSVG